MKRASEHILSNWRGVNQSMPKYVIQIVSKALNAEEKSVRSSHILILGMAYKADVDDTRESPSFQLIELSEQGADIDFFDAYVKKIPNIRKYPHLSGKKSVTWNEKTIRELDLVLISTAHSSVSYEELGKWARVIVDTRNVMADIDNVGAKVYFA